SPGGLELAERIPNEVEVDAHPLLDFLPRRGRQRARLVDELRDGAPCARRNAGVANHDLAQPSLWIVDGAHGDHDFVAYSIEAKAHDLEEQCFLAREVVIETSLGHAKGAGDVADRRGVESAFAKDLRGGPADLGAPGVQFRGRLWLGGHEAVPCTSGPAEPS